MNIRLVFLLVAFSRNNFFHENLSVKTPHTSNKNESGETYYSQWVNSRLPRSLLIIIVYSIYLAECTVQLSNTVEWFGVLLSGEFGHEKGEKLLNFIYAT